MEDPSTVTQKRSVLPERCPATLCCLDMSAYDNILKLPARMLQSFSVHDSMQLAMKSVPFRVSMYHSRGVVDSLIGAVDTEADPGNGLTKKVVGIGFDDR